MEIGFEIVAHAVEVDASCQHVEFFDKTNEPAASTPSHKGHEPLMNFFVIGASNEC